MIDEQNALTPIHEQNALIPDHAAQYLGVSKDALRLWRSQGKGPRYFKAGEKLIRYRIVISMGFTTLGCWRRAAKGGYSKSSLHC